MVGSTFVYSPDLQRLGELALDLDIIEEFAHVNMDALVTLDFEAVCREANVPWGYGEPVIFDEQSGLAIFQINPQGLKYVADNKEKFDSDQFGDVELLKAFILKNDFNHVYEIATF